MAINRFVNVDWDQPISSFVPRPFEAALIAGKQAQDQYDTGKKISGELDKLSEAIKVAPHDDPAKQKMLNDYRSAIKETVDKYQGSYGNPDFQYEASNIVNQFKNDKRLSTFANNLAVWDDYKKYKSDDKNSMSLVHNEGQLVTPEGSIAYNDPLNPKAFTPLRTTRYANEVDEYSKYFDKIKEDAQSINSVDYQGKAMGEGYYFIDSNGQHKFIHQDKIDKITNANLPGFLRSEAGTYALRERLVKSGLDNILKQNFGIDAQAINSNNYKQILGQLKDFAQQEIPEYNNKGKVTGKTKIKNLSAAEWLDQDIKSNMSGYGQQFIHDVREVDYHRTADEVRNARIKRAQEKAEEETVETSYLPSASMEGIAGDLSKLEVEKPSSFWDTKLGSLAKGFMFDLTGDTKYTKYGAKDIKFTPEQEKIYEQAAHFYGQTALGAKEKAEMVNQYLSDWTKKKLNIAYNQYTNAKHIKDMNNVYFGTEEGGAYAASNKKMKLIIGEGPTSGQGEDIMKEFGNKDKYVLNVEGDLTPDNPYFAAGKVVTVRDKGNGEVKARYAMEGSAQEVAKNASAHKLFNNIKYNITGESKIKDVKGNPYIIKYVEKPGTVVPTDASGKFIWSNKFNLPEKGSGEATIIAIPLDKNGKPMTDSRGYTMAAQTPYSDNPINDLIDLINTGSPTQQFTPVKDYVYNK